MPPHDHRRLTAEEWARLAQRGLRTRTTPAGPAHDTAVANAVAAAQACRATGAGWAEIALALGITEAELRRWRLAVTWDKPPHFARPKEFVPRQPSTTLNRNVVLLLAGTMKTNDCDFVTEIATIRRSLKPARLNGVVERFDIEITDIVRYLNEHQPAVLHLAAHHDDGLVHLTLDGIPVVVQSVAVRYAIESAHATPTLAVFSMCHSDYLAADVVEGIASVAAAIGWRGQVLDDQTAAFGAQLYPNLAAGMTVGEAFDLAQIAVSTAWPDRAAPYLAGDGAHVPLPH